MAEVSHLQVGSVLQEVVSAALFRLFQLLLLLVAMMDTLPPVDQLSDSEPIPQPSLMYIVFIFSPNDQTSGTMKKWPHPREVTPISQSFTLLNCNMNSKIRKLVLQGSFQSWQCTDFQESHQKGFTGAS